MWVQHDRRGRWVPGWCIFPGYKWCGPGCSGPGAPVNEIDACCMAHDLCYHRFGPSCFCDHALLHCLRPKINPYTRQGRQAALIYDYMKFQQMLTCTFF